MNEEAKEYLRKSKDPHATALNMIQSKIDTASCWVSDAEKVEYIKELFQALEEIEFERKIDRW